MFVADLTEDELIARIQAHLPPPPDWLLIGIGDDAAVIEPERNLLEVLTVDALVDGVHFDRRFTPPAAVGHRALAANLSDLAAMGASPRLALLSLALPEQLAVAEFEAMVGGLAALAGRHRLHVAGGNLTRTPGPLVVDITVVGSVKRRRPLVRSGAKPGDAVYVTGSIGAAAAGLQFLKRAPESGPPGIQPCVDRFLFPDPRVRAGLLLSRNRAATACMDLSDGLGDALHKVARASHVGMAIDADRLPVEPGARRWFETLGEDAVTASLSGGDDYELLFTSNPRHKGQRAQVERHAGVAITCIGVCTAEPELVLRRIKNGTSSDDRIPSGFSHFKK